MSFATGMGSGGLPVVSFATANTCGNDGHGVHQVFEI